MLRGLVGSIHAMHLKATINNRPAYRALRTMDHAPCCSGAGSTARRAGHASTCQLLTCILC